MARKAKRTTTRSKTGTARKQGKKRKVTARAATSDRARKRSASRAVPRRAQTAKRKVRKTMKRPAGSAMAPTPQVSAESANAGYVPSTGGPEPGERGGAT